MVRKLAIAGLIWMVLSIAATGSAAAATKASGYYVTFAARACGPYSDVFANKARNDIVESLEDLGPDSQYGNSGALVSPS